MKINMSYEDRLTEAVLDYSTRVRPNELTLISVALWHNVKRADLEHRLTVVRETSAAREVSDPAPIATRARAPLGEPDDDDGKPRDPRFPRRKEADDVAEQIRALGCKLGDGTEIDLLHGPQA